MQQGYKGYERVPILDPENNLVSHGAQRLRVTVYSFLQSLMQSLLLVPIVTLNDIIRR